MKEKKLLTKYKEKIVLASSSETRVNILKKYIDSFLVKPHKIRITNTFNCANMTCIKIYFKI